MTKTSSRASVPLLIEGDNVSEAYCKLLLHIANNPGLEVSPLVLTVDGFPADYSVPEDSAVRSTLDALTIRLAEGTDAFNAWRTELKKSETTAGGASGRASY
ncbi:hypothetical protein QP178_05750 [Sphingomonas aurantiaca]|uniref:hypothetical protein n=1 Tax=Sphingomonas aurantiaca TaxID=185949 RepID=UPI002FE24DF7